MIVFFFLSSYPFRFFPPCTPGEMDRLYFPRRVSNANKNVNEYIARQTLVLCPTNSTSKRNWLLTKNNSASQRSMLETARQWVNVLAPRSHLTPFGSGEIYHMNLALHFTGESALKHRAPFPSCCFQLK